MPVVYQVDHLTPPSSLLHPAPPPPTPHLGGEVGSLLHYYMLKHVCPMCNWNKLFVLEI